MNEKVLYVCRHCKHASASPSKRCVSCGEFSDFLPQKKVAVPLCRSRTLNEIKKITTTRPRIESRIAKINTLLNGGFVLGSVTLLAGEPGVGKSTLALQLFEHALYVSGEETLEQVAFRAERLELSAKLRYLNESDITDTLRELHACELPVLVVDSIQTSFADDASDVGSITEIKSVANALIDYAKKTGCVVLIVGHITKDGTIAGPETLMHMVDTVLQFSGQDEDSPIRCLRVNKNRFGPAPARELLEMTASGLK
jgi:DNA repair protein RadA/Sms